MRERKKKKNVKMCIITVKGVFLQDSRIFIVTILSFFWLLPVGAAHGTPFYSQHARLICKVAAYSSGYCKNIFYIV